MLALLRLILFIDQLCAIPLLHTHRLNPINSYAASCHCATTPTWVHPPTHPPLPTLTHPSTPQADRTSSEMKGRCRSDESAGHSEGGSGGLGASIKSAAESAAKKIEGAADSIPFPEFPPPQADEGSEGRDQGSGEDRQGFGTAAELLNPTASIGSSGSSGAEVGEGADRLAGAGLEGLSEQARITAAVLGVPYVESEVAASGNAPAGVTLDCTTAQQQLLEQKSEGDITPSAVIGEDPVLIRVPPAPADSTSTPSSLSDSSDRGSASGSGFSGGRVYDSTGSADFSWGVGEVVKESGYYAYRSCDEASNAGIGRRSSTGHRGAAAADDDEDTA